MSMKAAIIFGACLVGSIIVALPNFRPFHPGMRPSCVANLRQLQGAKQSWALEFHRRTDDVVTADVLRPYLRIGLTCPQGGVYTLGRVGELPSCSISEHTAQYRQHP